MKNQTIATENHKEIESKRTTKRVIAVRISRVLELKISKFASEKKITDTEAARRILTDWFNHPNNLRKIPLRGKNSFDLTNQRQLINEAVR